MGGDSTMAYAHPGYIKNAYVA